MKSDTKRAAFSDSILAGFYAGFILTVVSIIFDVLFREMTGFNGDSILNPAIIFTIIPLIGLVAGLLYYAADGNMKYTGIVFAIVFIALTVVGVVYTDTELVRHNAILLVSGFVIISGLGTALMVPYLIKHPRLFMDDEAIRWSGTQQWS